jgi:hypothetical protein
VGFYAVKRAFGADERAFKSQAEISSGKMPSSNAPARSSNKPR